MSPALRFWNVGNVRSRSSAAGSKTFILSNASVQAESLELTALITGIAFLKKSMNSRTNPHISKREERDGVG